MNDEEYTFCGTIEGEHRDSLVMPTVCELANTPNLCEERKIEIFQKRLAGLINELKLTKMEMDLKVKSLNQANEFLIDRCKELEKKLAESV